ncbi:hypothetical protein BDC45DRAFT_563611 [Circinella umbellata]|nr:hypothetical protein BDC45DRAFT_563611 [Circinella umbellata]
MRGRRSTGGQAMHFPRFDDDDYLGDMAATDDQLEGKRYSFPRFDETITLANMVTTDDQLEGKRYSFPGSTTTLPWRHGGNGRSTGGQAMQFSTVRRRRLPWRHGDNDDQLEASDQFSTIRRRHYLGGMATKDDQLEGKRYSFSGSTTTTTLATWRQRSDDQDEWKTVSGWGSDDQDEWKTVSGWGSNEQGRWKTVSGWGTINWKASDTVFHDSTTTTLATWRQRSEEQGRWKTVSGWG